MTEHIDGSAEVGNLIVYSSLGKEYIISERDFEKVEEYCENECMGIKFLINANFLRQLVKSLFRGGFRPPFTNEDFSSDEYRDHLIKEGMIDTMEKMFGADDVELVSKIVIKSTYNFLHKI